VVLLILESLGSTELLFILLMALVFFGPRKLPQLSRKLGKNLADFRRASEDFKRTWDREVSIEEADGAAVIATQPPSPEPNSILDHEIATQEKTSQFLQAPVIEAVAPDRVIARHSIKTETLPSSDENAISEQRDFNEGADEAKPSPKHDWL
jgi:TatA/E family protein of Tat protein translocase